MSASWLCRRGSGSFAALLSAFIGLLGLTGSRAIADEMTGQFSTSSPLTDRKAVGDRLGWPAGTGADYNLQQESFWIYLPKNYDPKHPPGILVRPQSNCHAVPLKDLEPACDARNLILVTNLDNALGGLKEAMFVDAVDNLKATYAIDPRRIYVDGVGMDVERLTFGFPDVFTGGIYEGFDVYRKVNIPWMSYHGGIVPADAHVPSATWRSKANHHPMVMTWSTTPGATDATSAGQIDQTLRKVSDFATENEKSGLKLGKGGIAELASADRENLQLYVIMQSLKADGFDDIRPVSINPRDPHGQQLEKFIDLIDLPKAGTEDPSTASPEPRPLSVPGVPVGEQTIHYTDSSKLTERKSVADRLGMPAGSQDYVLSQVTFWMYVPKSYDPKNPPGILVWPQDGCHVGPRPDFEQICDASNLILVTDLDRSIQGLQTAMFVDAVDNLEKTYKINTKRIYAYADGMLGEQLVMGFPEMFTGGIYTFFDLYRVVPLPWFGHGAGLNPEDSRMPPAKWRNKARHIPIVMVYRTEPTETDATSPERIQATIKQITAVGLAHANDRGDVFHIPGSYFTLSPGDQSKIDRQFVLQSLKQDGFHAVMPFTIGPKTNLTQKLGVEIAMLDSAMLNHGPANKPAPSDKP